MWTDSTLRHNEVKSLPHDDQFSCAMSLVSHAIVDTVVDLAKIPRTSEAASAQTLQADVPFIAGTFGVDVSTVTHTQQADGHFISGSFGVDVSTVTHRKRVAKRKVSSNTCVVVCLL